MIVNDIITRALKAIMACGAGETPSAEESQDGLDALNSMIRQWNVESTSIFGETIAAYNLIQGQQTYTIGGPGLGANFDAPRPTKITNANLIVTGTVPIRYPIEIIIVDQWADIRVQTQPVGAFPGRLYCDMAFPVATIYLWGVPTSGLQLELFTWQQISSFEKISDPVSLPGEYEEPVIYNLAVRLAPMFGKSVSPEVAILAQNGKANLARYNAVTPVMQVDPAVGRETRGIFNIMGDFGGL